MRVIIICGYTILKQTVRVNSERGEKDGRVEKRKRPRRGDGAGLDLVGDDGFEPPTLCV